LQRKKTLDFIVQRNMYLSMPARPGSAHPHQAEPRLGDGP
jgi:hypothetical protein